MRQWKISKLQKPPHPPTHPKKEKEKERYDLLHQYDDPHCLLLSVSVSHTHAHAYSERQIKCNTLNAQPFHPKETKRNQKLIKA
jgi:hypothetical protein